MKMDLRSQWLGTGEATTRSLDSAIMAPSLNTASSTIRMVGKYLQHRRHACQFISSPQAVLTSQHHLTSPASTLHRYRSQQHQVHATPDTGHAISTGALLASRPHVGASGMHAVRTEGCSRWALDTTRPCLASRYDRGITECEAHQL